ncbi:MAG: mechanosensitive ion channel family protein [Bacilli bacterium]|nr:mechanosensitive ion channel family protein [Bacilli bacterium]
MNELLKKETIGPIIVVLVCILIYLLVKTILNKIEKKLNKNNERRQKTLLNLINNIAIVVIVILGTLVILEIYGVDTKSLIASFGIVGLITGLALQDMLKDFIVGMTIIFERQFSIGDWVSINNFKGQVMPSSLRTTRLKSYTGEVKIIYNRNITEIINYSLENVNLVVDVEVVNTCNVDEVKKILDELCLRLKEEYKLKKIFCSGINEILKGSIKFRIVALSNFSDQFKLENELKREIVLTLNKNDIKMP